MARPEELARGFPVRGLIGLALILSIAPVIAHFFGILVPDGRWVLPWALLVVPQLVWCALESNSQPRTASGEIDQTCRLSLAQGASALGVIFLAIWTVTTSGAPLPAVRTYAMLLLFALGIALRMWAIRNLGSRFRNDIAISPSHPLETDGIYEKMRHPSELGLMLILGSAAALAGSLSAAAVFLLISVPLTLWRMRCEDRLLLAEYGDDGSSYVKNTPAWSLLCLLRPN